MGAPLPQELQSDLMRPVDKHLRSNQDGAGRLRREDDAAPDGWAPAGAEEEDAAPDGSAGASCKGRVALGGAIAS